MSERMLPAGVDAECVALCNALNRLPGVRTTESCCGHGKSEYHVFFRCESQEDVVPVCYWADG